MVSKKLLVFIILCTTQLNSMDSVSAPNFFNKLPLKIGKIIAYYLNNETEEEFIERSKKICVMQMGILLSCEKREAYVEKYPRMTKFKHTMVSPRYGINKAAIIQPLSNEQSSFIIVDTNTDEKLYQILFNSKNATNYYCNSCTKAELFVIIQSEEDEYEEIRNCLMVFFPSQQKKEKLIIPDNFDFCTDFVKFPSTIAFNKQGTHIIILGQNQDKDQTKLHYSTHKKQIRDHLIFPLTVTKREVLPDKETLEYYFAQKRICKELKLNIK